jgi:CelD/BcsL family acetyltransferase involved in cellulose biosynthesis
LRKITFIKEISFENLQNIHKEWDIFVKKNRSNIHISYDWCKLWWDHCGKNYKLRVYVFSFDSEIIGIIPICIDYINFCLVSFNIAKIIGAEISASVHASFRLPETFEEYLDGFSKKEKKNCRKYELGYLKKRFNAEVDTIIRNNDLKKEFNNFIKIHTQQWRNLGRPGYFGAWPNSEEQNLSLINAFGKSGNLRLIKILADDSEILYEYAFKFGDKYFWKLPARKIGKDWDKYSLGKIGIVTMIYIAIKEGIRIIEGGVGHYNYKIRLGASEEFISTYKITARGIKSRIASIVLDYIFYNDKYYLL